jgi:hypothetical protein
MKKLKSLLLNILVTASLALSSTSVDAVEAFEQAGPIGAINHAGFLVERQLYRIAPGARVKSFDASRSRLSDFKRGDVIIFKGKVISGVYYVDMITYHAPKPN